MIRKKNRPIQAKQNSSSPDNHAKLTFLEHFYELRKRLFWIALTLAVTTSVGLEIKDWLIAIIVTPLKGARLIYLTPGGGFSFIFTLSLYFGALLTIPVITYHIYRFLQPMLRKTSRRFVLTFVGISTGLALLGAGLAYYLAIPSALGFLNDVSGNSIVPNLTADSYLRFVVTYIVGLAALFQLPLLIFLVDHVRPIPPGVLKRTQRYGIVASAVLAGFMTPSPDLMNYAIVLFPIIAAYEIGVLAVYLRRRMQREKKTAAATEQVRVSEQSKQAEKLMPAHEIIDELVGKTKPLTAIVEAAVADTAVQAVMAVQKPVVGRRVMDIRPMDRQQTPVTPLPELRDISMKSRTIDGVHRVPARYKTNVQVPVRQAVVIPKKSPKKSIDGFLTAQA